MNRADSAFNDYSVTHVNASGEKLPEDFRLLQNYPNPFNPSTQIGLNVPQSQLNRTTELSVFDLNGKKVTTIVQEVLTPGFYQFSWDGKDQSGRQVSSGLYFYKLKTGKLERVRRMVFIR